MYNKLANNTPATVTVPDNLITPDEDMTKPDSSDTEKPDSSGTQTPSSSADTFLCRAYTKHHRRNKESGNH